MSNIREKLADKKSKLAKTREDQEDHPADLNNYPEGGFYQIDLESVLPNPDQPRKYFDEERLAEAEPVVSNKREIYSRLITFGGTKPARFI